MHGQENETEALERILTDASAEPIMLSYTFLESITENFSKDREIGTGGFGVVYMGIIQNMKVAIKKLSRIDDFSEKQFEDELKCLKRVKHKNIVRLLGYCSDTPKQVVKYKGAYVLAEYRIRILCFEYVPNKSLLDYIRDQSREREWDTSYQLIEGVCRGLHYLHNKERINHLDLKPANILLDADMIPKITDFGLSRRFSGEWSRIITEHICGTPGYIAPEYLNKGEISFKTDIYSLGIIIKKLLMLHKPAGRDCPRMERCITIAELCVDHDQQRRPTIDSIINMLINVKQNVKDNAKSSVEKGSNSIQLPRMDTGKMHFTSEIDFHETTEKVVTETDIYSLEFCFPFKPNNHLQCPVTLTNETDHYVGVWITPIGKQLWAHKSLEYPCSFFFMKPKSTLLASVTAKKQQPLPPPDICKFEMMLIVLGSEHDHPNLESTNGSKLLKLVEESGGKLPQALLTAATPTNRKIVMTHQVAPARKFGYIFSMDVHLTEPWILTGHEGGFISIWSYQTQRRVKSYKVTTCSICSVKFLVRDQSIAVVAGDANGWVHVINDCFKMSNVKTFEAHPKKIVDSLAVHTTYPILLSSSFKDNKIMLWDWDQGWVCTRIFQGHTSGVRRLAFNPRDINTFASVGMDDDAKVWNINSSSNIAQLSVEPEKVDYFFTGRRAHFVISCDAHIENADIWDLQTKDHLQTLGVFGHRNLPHNDVRVNSRGKRSGRMNQIAGQIKEDTKDNGKQNSGEHANNVSDRGVMGSSSSSPWSATMRTNMMGGASYPVMDQTGGDLTSKPMVYPNMSVQAAGFYPQHHYSMFSDENPNGCWVM
ncbi:unnamed protein product [Urochloa humidicola]